MAFKTQRLKAQKTVSEVMEHMGVSDAAVYQWETGIYTPRADKLIKLAKFYGCSVDDLLAEDLQGDKQI